MRATLTVRVRGADGQLLLVSKDGLPAGIVPILGDDFTHTFAATRDPVSGPLGTFWRVDTFDLQSLTTIGNPVFLQGAAAASRPAAAPRSTAMAAPAHPGHRRTRRRRSPRCWPRSSGPSRRSWPWRAAPDAIRCRRHG